MSKFEFTVKPKLLSGGNSVDRNPKLESFCCNSHFKNLGPVLFRAHENPKSEAGPFCSVLGCFFKKKPSETGCCSSENGLGRGNTHRPCGQCQSGGLN